MKAYAYARFSSDQQREESIDAQLRAIREYAQAHDITIVREYTDEARSATTDRRPGFLAIFESDLSGIDFVIVHKLDRFSRDRYDSAIYKRELKRKGVRLLSVLERLDDSPESIILESVIEGMAEYYSRNLARETMKGLRENAFKCKHTGGKPPLGYDVIDGYLQVNLAEAELVRRIFAMYADGRKYDDIVSALGASKTKLGLPFTKTSLNSILANEKYTGTYTFGKQSRKNHNSHKTTEDFIRIPNGIPRIIDDQTWTICQDRLRNRKRNSATTAKRVYILSGKIECRCGRTMNGATSANKKGEYRYYRCPGCRTAVSADKLEKEVTERISKYLAFQPGEAEHLHDLLVQDQKRKAESSTAQELRMVQVKIGNLVQAISDGISHPAVRAELDRLGSREAELRAEMDSITVPPVEKIEEFLQAISDVGNRSPEEQKQIINRLVDKIKIAGSQFEIDFRLPLVAGDGYRSWLKFTVSI